MIDGMCVLQPNRHGVWSSFLPSQAQLSPTLLSTEGHAWGLVEALPGLALQVDILCIDPRFSLLWQAGRRHFTTCQQHAVTISIPVDRPFEAWLSSRSGSLRNSLKRFEKRAKAESYPLEFRRIDSLPELQAAIVRYATLEGAGWKGRAGTALDSSTAQFAFYSEVMSKFAMMGQAHIYELWCGPRLAASRLVIRQGTTLINLKTAYDETLRDWAPGRLLLFRVVEDVFRNWPGVAIEFYTNATLDQLSWVSEQRSIIHLSIRRAGAIGSVVRFTQAFRKRAPVGAVSRPENGRLEEKVAEVSVSETLDQELEQFFASHERRHFQLGLDWWRVFCRTVTANSVGARMMAFRRGGRPVAVLPVNVDPSLQSLGGMVGALSNYYSSIYSPLLARDATGLDLLPLARRLREECRGHPVLKFEPMDPTGDATAALEWALDVAGYAVSRYWCSGNWFLPVTQSWDSYLEARPGELRSTIRRMSRRLEARGGRLQVFTSEADLATALTAFETVYARSWKAREPVAGFISVLASVAARRGWLRLGVAWLGDQPIAAQLWVVSDRRASIYKLAHDAGFKQLSPGTVLTAHLMRHVFEKDRVLEVDFMMGDDAFKGQWMTHRRERCGVVAHDLRSTRGWVHELWQRMSRVRQRLTGRMPTQGGANL
jgi:CelD/BcsL family acetyltransferase involved in cellulose biosynthesis